MGRRRRRRRGGRGSRSGCRVNQLAQGGARTSLPRTRTTNALWDFPSHTSRSCRVASVGHFVNITAIATFVVFKDLLLKQIKNEMAHIPDSIMGCSSLCNMSQLLRLIIWGVVNNQLLAHWSVRLATYGGVFGEVPKSYVIPMLTHIVAFWVKTQPDDI